MGCKLFNTAIVLASMTNMLPAFAVSSTQLEEINLLLRYIEQTDCIVERNGDKHTGSEAVKHVRKKYKHFADEINTTEDFIRLSASKSTLSGKHYRVFCPDGYHNTTQQWLSQQLHLIRKNNNAQQ